MNITRIKITDIADREGKTRVHPPTHRTFPQQLPVQLPRNWPWQTVKTHTVFSKKGETKSKISNAGRCRIQKLRKVLKSNAHMNFILTFSSDKMKPSGFHVWIHAGCVMQNCLMQQTFQWISTYFLDWEDYCAKKRLKMIMVQGTNIKAFGVLWIHCLLYWPKFLLLEGVGGTMVFYFRKTELLGNTFSYLWWRICWKCDGKWRVPLREGKKLAQKKTTMSTCQKISRKLYHYAMCRWNWISHYQNDI